jgi:hypothetical protein
VVFPHNYCTNLTAHCQCKYAQIGRGGSFDFATEREKSDCGTDLPVTVIFAGVTAENSV